MLQAWSYIARSTRGINFPRRVIYHKSLWVNGRKGVERETAGTDVNGRIEEWNGDGRWNEMEDGRERQRIEG